MTLGHYADLDKIFVDSRCFEVQFLAWHLETSTAKERPHQVKLVREALDICHCD